jgi:hypothetical protein
MMSRLRILCLLANLVAIGGADAQTGSNLSSVFLRTIADLRAVSGVADSTDATVQGYYKRGDGGGGHFYFDVNSSDPDDGGMTISPMGNPGTGRWKRIFEGAISVKWFGAVGDGISIDSPSIQAALDYVVARGGGRVYLPKGVFFLGSDQKSTLRVGNDTALEGDGTGSVIISFGPQAIRNANSDDPNNYGNTHITIQNLSIDCRRVGTNAIVLGSVIDSTIHNVTVKDPVGYAIWLYRLGDTPQAQGNPTRRVTVEGCHITGIRDVGIECSGAVECTIVGNTVTGSRGIAGYYAWNGSTDCVFLGNVAEGEGATNHFTGLAVQPADPLLERPPGWTQTQRITFVGNVVRNAKHGIQITGSPDNQVSDILFQGNSFLGLGNSGRGAEIENATRIRIKDNHFEGFLEPLIMNDVLAGFSCNGASYVSMDGNSVLGGDRSTLVGNIGGSLNANRFFGQESNAAVLFGWKNCTANGNTFVEAGADQDSVGMVVEDYNDIASEGNDFSANRGIDNRPVQHLIATVVFNTGDQNRNLVTRNVAVGAAPGAAAFYSLGSGTNIVVDNIGN